MFAQGVRMYLFSSSKPVIPGGQNESRDLRTNNTFLSKIGAQILRLRASRSAQDGRLFDFPNHFLRQWNGFCRLKIMPISNSQFSLIFVTFLFYNYQNPLVFYGQM